MITVATVYFEAKEGSPHWTHAYRPHWVDKLYRQVARNYSDKFQFVCLTDKTYDFDEPIVQMQLHSTNWRKACIQMYGLEAKRIVAMGLDTMIVGNVDDIFAYNGDLAVPMDPYNIGAPCNAVVLCPQRLDIVAAGVKAEDDMTVFRKFDYEKLDDLFPGQILSYKVHVKGHPLGDARIVYFHGPPKQHQLTEDWAVRAWNGR